MLLLSFLNLKERAGQVPTSSALVFLLALFAVFWTRRYVVDVPESTAAITAYLRSGRPWGQLRQRHGVIMIGRQ